MLAYHTIPVTPFQQNCSLVWDDQTLQAAVIDPGGDLPLLLQEVRRLGLRLEQIWVTHGHLDHCSGAADLAEQLGLPIIGPHPGDQFWIDGLPQQRAQFGFPQAEMFTPNRWLADGHHELAPLVRRTHAEIREYRDSLDATDAPALPELTARIARSFIAHQNHQRFADYRTAVLTPGLSPAQRRLLFAAALRDLERYRLSTTR